MLVRTSTEALQPPRSTRETVHAVRIQQFRGVQRVMSCRKSSFNFFCLCGEKLQHLLWVRWTSSAALAKWRAADAQLVRQGPPGTYVPFKSIKRSWRGFLFLSWKSMLPVRDRKRRGGGRRDGRGGERKGGEWVWGSHTCVGVRVEKEEIQVKWCSAACLLGRIHFTCRNSLKCETFLHLITVKFSQKWEYFTYTLRLFLVKFDPCQFKWVVFVWPKREKW